MMFVALYITYRISKSKFGYYLLAIKNDLEAAESLGVNIAQSKLKAAAISGFLTGIGGPSTLNSSFSSIPPTSSVHTLPLRSCLLPSLAAEGRCSGRFSVLSVGSCV